MNASRARQGIAAAVVIAIAAFFGAGHFAHPPSNAIEHAAAAIPAAHVVPVNAPKPALPTLSGSDGSTFSADSLRGRWTILFPTLGACTQACMSTLHALAAVARDPSSGVADGSAQIVFLSPSGEPQRLHALVDQAGALIIDVNASREATEQFLAAIGAQTAALTSAAQEAPPLLVLDPEGRSAGALPHTLDPGRIVSGLATLRASSATAPGSAG